MPNPNKTFSELAKKKPGRPPGSGGMHSVTKRNVMHVQRMFQEHAEEALETLVSIMRDDGADHAVRVRAANDVLNRAYGTPVSTQVVMQLSDDENKTPVNPTQIGRASTEELQAVLATLQNFLEAESKMVDVTPTNDYEKNS
jgi:hypothetical protein